MKELLFEKHVDLNKRTKAFSVDSETEDSQCRTKVHKSFMYAVDLVKGSEPKPRQPLVFIRKSVDTKRRIEGFSFHVKGYFYIAHEEELMKVLFHHILDIELKWKTKKLSPKNPISSI